MPFTLPGLGFLLCVLPWGSVGDQTEDVALQLGQCWVRPETNPGARCLTTQTRLSCPTSSPSPDGSVDVTFHSPEGKGGRALGKAGSGREGRSWKEAGKLVLWASQAPVQVLLSESALGVCQRRKVLGTGQRERSMPGVWGRVGQDPQLRSWVTWAGGPGLLLLDVSHFLTCAVEGGPAGTTKRSSSVLHLE